MSACLQNLKAIMYLLMKWYNWEQFNETIYYEDIC